MQHFIDCQAANVQEFQKAQCASVVSSEGGFLAKVTISVVVLQMAKYAVLKSLRSEAMKAACLQTAVSESRQTCLFWVTAGFSLEA